MTFFLSLNTFASDEKLLEAVKQFEPFHLGVKSPRFVEKHFHNRKRKVVEYYDNPKKLERLLRHLKKSKDKRVIKKAIELEKYLQTHNGLKSCSQSDKERLLESSTYCRKQNTTLNESTRILGDFSFELAFKKTLKQDYDKRRQAYEKISDVNRLRDELNTYRRELQKIFNDYNTYKTQKEKEWEEDDRNSHKKNAHYVRNLKTRRTQELLGVKQAMFYKFKQKFYEISKIKNGSLLTSKLLYEKYFKDYGNDFHNTNEFEPIANINPVDTKKALEDSIDFLKKPIGDNVAALVVFNPQVSGKILAKYPDLADTICMYINAYRADEQWDTYKDYGFVAASVVAGLGVSAFTTFMGGSPGLAIIMGSLASLRVAGWEYNFQDSLATKRLLHMQQMANSLLAQSGDDMSLDEMNKKIQDYEDSIWSQKVSAFGAIADTASLGQATTIVGLFRLTSRSGKVSKIAKAAKAASQTKYINRNLLLGGRPVGTTIKVGEVANCRGCVSEAVITQTTLDHSRRHFPKRMRSLHDAEKVASNGTKTSIVEDKFFRKVLSNIRNGKHKIISSELNDGNIAQKISIKIKDSPHEFMVITCQKANCKHTRPGTSIVDEYTQGDVITIFPLCGKYVMKVPELRYIERYISKNPNQEFKIGGNKAKIRPVACK